MIRQYDVFISVIPFDVNKGTLTSQVILTLNRNKPNLDISKLTIDNFVFTKIHLPGLGNEELYRTTVHCCFNLIDYIKELCNKLNDQNIKYNNLNLK